MVVKRAHVSGAFLAATIAALMPGAPLEMERRIARPAKVRYRKTKTAQKRRDDNRAAKRFKLKGLRP